MLLAARAPASKQASVQTRMADIVVFGFDVPLDWCSEAVETATASNISIQTISDSSNFSTPAKY